MLIMASCRRSRTVGALNPSNLDLDLVRTFVTICEAGTFARAAERVGRTPSAVSLQVKRLEERLGRALFLRQPRAVVPTAEVASADEV
ncbi:hypothetical protein AX289_27445 [Methylorubrum populi]|nr:hypothetical protein AX289_27445 [Methylorubrum populi]